MMTDIHCWFIPFCPACIDCNTLFSSLFATPQVSYLSINQCPSLCDEDVPRRWAVVHTWFFAALYSSLLPTWKNQPVSILRLPVWYLFVDLHQRWHFFQPCCDPECQGVRTPFQVLLLDYSDNPCNTLISLGQQNHHFHWYYSLTLSCYVES